MIDHSPSLGKFDFLSALIGHRRPSLGGKRPGVGGNKISQGFQSAFTYRSNFRRTVTPVR